MTLSESVKCGEALSSLCYYLDLVMFCYAAAASAKVKSHISQAMR
jgi:hypothetical protein